MDMATFADTYANDLALVEEVDVFSIPNPENLPPPSGHARFA